MHIGDAALVRDGRAVLLFLAPGDDRLRGLVWGETVSGIAGAARISPTTGWHASPYGSRYLIYDDQRSATVFDLDGTPIGRLPWSGSHYSASFARDGRSVCAVRPTGPSTVDTLRLEVAAPGEPARVIAAGFGTYSDNASFPVLACDFASDRAIVAAFGQGLFAARFWVIQLSTGAILHAEDLGRGSPSSDLAVSADGMLVAHSTRQEMSGTPVTVVRRADSATPLQTIPDFEAQGFSGDSTLLVGIRGPRGPAITPATAVVEWRSGREVWRATGLGFGGYRPDPTGGRIAIGLGFAGGSDDREVYVVAPDGSSAALPSGTIISLSY